MKYQPLLILILALMASCNRPSVDSTPQASGDGNKVLRFSAIPDQNMTEIKEKFDAVADYLSEKLEVNVEYVPSSDYKASVDAFKSGDIQLAWFGGLTGVQARAAVPGAQAIVQGKSDPVFKSYFIAHHQAGLERTAEFPAALAELSFSFGSESSTSGRLMPEYFLRENTGKSPAEFFQTAPTFSGSHDKTVELVETGQIQAGVVNFKVYDQRVADGKTDPNVCKVVWVTPEYADYNFTAHPDLEETFGEGTTDRLKQALITMDDSALLSAFPREALIEAKNEDFVGIEQVAKELGFLR